MTIGTRLKVFAGKWILKLLYSCNRWKFYGDLHYDDYLVEGKSVIIAAWHGRLLPVFMFFSGRGHYGLAGMHKDAEFISQIGARLGWNLLRGSSSDRGREVYREMVAALHEPGKLLAMTPDGPKGPAKIPKPGAIRVAQKTGAIIIPVIGDARRSWEFTNWDTFYVVKPFSTIHLVFGPPLQFSPEEDFQACCDRLKQALDETEKKAKIASGRLTPDESDPA
ncbi:MAG: lysophospholipid acyltransferase family protein [Fidelibacterota bacterium]